MNYTGNNEGFINYIYERYKNLKAKDILLVFEGQVTLQVIKTLTALVEKSLDEVEEDLVMRRVYHVMMESLQNINRHAESYEYKGHPYPGRGVIMVAKNRERYQITTGNIIETSHVDELAMFLGKLNNMDLDALDDIYNNQVHESTDSPKAIAGLGFIDIRRKTGTPLDYSFISMDEETSFFIFTSTVGR